MAEAAVGKSPSRSGISQIPRGGVLRQWGTVAFAAGVIAVMTIVFSAFRSPESPVLVESTVGQLALWQSEQFGIDQASALESMRTLISVLILVQLGLTLAGVLGILANAKWSRTVLMGSLVLLDVVLFTVPVLENDSTSGLVLIGIALMLVVLLLAPGRVTKALGFLVVLSALFVGWETFKGFAQSVDYKITLPQENWTYTGYSTLDEAISALNAGEVSAVIADEKDMRDIQNITVLEDINKEVRVAGFEVIPAFPERLGVAVRPGETAESVSEFVALNVGTISGEFAEERFLPEPRELRLVDLSTGNDLKMPHLQTIAEALLQPARRNGDQLLLTILLEAARFTWMEALVGFVMGAILGFLLGTVFAHSRLLERGLLPYVVASQTVPILAIAPMIVIWLGASWLSVAVIAAYLTFFPVTINTLRGLHSPSPNAVELMHSYAAPRLSILINLRIPSALPYIFTALKVSATASVVGAIIGELPSGIADGLGRAILNFNQYYTSDPAKLWAAIFIAALVGITFFFIVAGIERLVLPQRMRGS
jgi:NitT/TauT family transport system permease protein